MRMRYVIIIGDGMADEPIEALGSKTPLEAVAAPSFARAAGGSVGMALTVPQGMPPGSDTAILSIFGCDPRACYTGRSPLEAAGCGLPLHTGDVSMRLNLASVTDGVMRSHCGGGIGGADILALMNDLKENAAYAQALKALHMRVLVTDTFRQMAAMPAPADTEFHLTEPHNILGEPIGNHMPRGAMSAELCALMRASHDALKAHPINQAREAQGLLPANMLWPWGAGRASVLPRFFDVYHKTASVISAVPLVQGIGALSGLDVIHVPGATGDLDTTYEGKAAAALAALRAGQDTVFAHVEAPDEMAHAGSLEKKLRAIEFVSERLLRPLFQGLDEDGEPYRLLLMPDHPTLLRTRTHDGAPVPFALYDSRHPGEPRVFCEALGRQSARLITGSRLLSLLYSDGDERR